MTKVIEIFVANTPFIFVIAHPAVTEAALSLHQKTTMITKAKSDKQWKRKS